MNRKNKQDRLATLQEKGAFGELTPQEEKELERLAEYLENPTTEGQLDYIDTLLDKLGADLDEYTDTDVELLTFDEASELYSIDFSTSYPIKVFKDPLYRASVEKDIITITGGTEAIIFMVENLNTKEALTL